MKNNLHFWTKITDNNFNNFLFRRFELWYYSVGRHNRQIYEVFFVNYFAKNCLCTWATTLCLLITKNSIKAILLRLITNGFSTRSSPCIDFSHILADIPSAEVYLETTSVSSEYCHNSRKFKHFEVGIGGII